MDLDGDGHLDLISGSYDPGSLYLFRGRGRGAFLAPEVMRDRNDRPILKVPDQKDPVESFGSWVTTVDWDDDGDLDLLVGTFDGMIFLRINEGTRTKPAYAPDNRWVKVGKKALRLPGGEHANPVIADWDGDGRWDIVTGAADGGVYWYRNRGERGRPEFEPPVVLVAKHEGPGYAELIEPGAEPKPGIRSQIAVVDHDGDGKLDLLVGDFATNLHTRPNLTPDQITTFRDIHKRQQAATAFLRQQMEDLRARFKEELTKEGIPPTEWSSPVNSARWQKGYQAMRDDPEYKARTAEHERLSKEVATYLDRSRSGKRLGDSPDVAHGYVWLFRRK